MSSCVQAARIKITLKIVVCAFMLDSPFEERLRPSPEGDDAFRVSAAFHTASAGIRRANDRILVKVLGAGDCAAFEQHSRSGGIARCKGIPAASSLGGRKGDSLVF